MKSTPLTQDSGGVNSPKKTKVFGIYSKNLLIL